MKTGASDDNARIRDQIEFYRAQARQGPPIGAHEAMPDELIAFLHAPIGAHGATPDELIRTYCPPSSHCLELGSGAGRWTGPLLNVCERITAVDTSPEMHAINRALNGDTRVEYVDANIFGYQPNTLYELVFAGFWLSHVPQSRFRAFGRCLRKPSRQEVESSWSTTAYETRTGPQGLLRMLRAQTPTADCLTAGRSRSSKTPTPRRN